MIYLRCPHGGCPIEVADDMLGARIRCPHCGQLLFVEPQQQQPAEPPPEPAPEGVHAGMPPLAALLGIREGRGLAWGEPRAARANMTDLDWQALAAFEKVLHAGGALHLAIGFGIAAALFMLFIWSGEAQVTSWETAFTPGRLVSRAASLSTLVVAFALMAIGKQRLARVQFGTWVSLASLAAAAVMVVFALNMLLLLQLLWHSAQRGGPDGPAGILATPMLLIAAFFAGRAILLVQRARAHASPHAIRHRLIDALAYLDWAASEEQLLRETSHPQRKLP